MSTRIIRRGDSRARAYAALALSNLCRTELTAGLLSTVPGAASSLQTVAFAPTHSPLPSAGPAGPAAAAAAVAAMEAEVEAAAGREDALRTLALLSRKRLGTFAAGWQPASCR